MIPVLQVIIMASLEKSVPILPFSLDGDEVTAGEWKSLVMAWFVTMSCQRYQMLNDDVRSKACSCYRYDRAARDMFQEAS